jgi:hypothetical protein
MVGIGEKWTKDPHWESTLRATVQQVTIHNPYLPIIRLYD